MALHWCSPLPDQSFAWPCVYLGLPLRCFQQHASRCYTQWHRNAFYKRKWASVSRRKWLGYKQGYRSSKSSSNFELRKGWLAAFHVRVSSERINCIQCFSRSLKAIGKLTFYDKHLISQNNRWSPKYIQPWKIPHGIFFSVLIASSHLSDYPPYFIPPCRSLNRIQ